MSYPDIARSVDPKARDNEESFSTWSETVTKIACTIFTAVAVSRKLKAPIDILFPER